MNSLNQKIIESKFIVKNGIKYYVDGKYVIFDYNKKELEIATWLVNTFGGTIYLLPRINVPENIKTADYLWNNEFWDLKEIKGSSNQVIYHAIYKNKLQCNNFILDITNSKLNLKKSIILVNLLFQREDTKFVNKIIIKKGNKYISIIKKEM